MRSALTAMPGIGGSSSSVPASAAPSVPESISSEPVLGPWLMPETTRSGRRPSGYSAVAASTTAVAGEPPTANAAGSFGSRRTRTLLQVKDRPLPLAL